jgi:hypothetical protein
MIYHTQGEHANHYTTIVAGLFRQFGIILGLFDIAG